MPSDPATSPVVRALLEREGLWPILDARARGDLGAIEQDAAWRDADLFALGALADVVRAREVGPVVRIHAGVPAGVTVLGRGAKDGLALLREVACARIASPTGARIAVDFAAAGMEIAEVALAFGASEFVGPVANKRGLAFAGDARRKVKGEGMVSAALLKQKDIARVLAGAGREARFEGAQG